MAMKLIVVGVHVYDDGDVELTHYHHKADVRMISDLTFTSEEALRKELHDYGFEDDTRITEALTELETVDTVTL